MEMEAGQHVPKLGRFVEVDPVEGGLDTNDYSYVKDPINEFDLDGNGFCAAGHNPKNGSKHGGCRGGGAARAGGRLVVRNVRCAGNPVCTGSYYGGVTATGCFWVCGSIGYSNAGGRRTLVVGTSGLSTPGGSVTWSPGRPTRSAGVSTGGCALYFCGGYTQDRRPGSPVVPYAGGGTRAYSSGPYGQAVLDAGPSE